MINKTIKVEGMSCEHCVKTITNVLDNKRGIKNTVIDLKKKEVNVEFDNKIIREDEIKDIIEEQGYDVIQ